MLYMDEVRTDSPFALRLVEGVEVVNPSASVQSIIKILLDGQQRTSSVFYSLYAPALALLGRKNPFAFFLSIDRLLAKDWENAVISVNRGQKKTLALYDSKRDYIAMTEFLNVGQLTARLLQEGKYTAQIADILNVVHRFNAYEIQMVQLDRGTPLDRVVETFERINRTGEPLSITDLLVARLYQHSIKLRDLLESATAKYKFLRDVDSEYILRVICLLRGQEVRRNVILMLGPSNFAQDWQTACDALEAAYLRITDAKNGYGAIDFRRLAPFTTSLVPLAAFIAYLRVHGLESAAQYAKVDRWYWTTVFFNRYNEGVNTSTFSDFTKMKDWFRDDNKVPDFITDQNLGSIDLTTDSKSSATFRGVFSLVALAGAHDFQTGNVPQFAPGEIQDDHIFPKVLFKEDSVLNRTIISTNQKKASQPPSKYFGAIETLVGRPQLEQVLSSHLIDANGLSSLLRDDLAGFMSAREATVRARIGALL
jgi:hypothetical protein